MESDNTPNSQSQSYVSLLNFPYDSFAPNVNIGSSQIPAFSSQTSSQPSQPPSQSEETAEQHRERRIWSTQDDLVLISGWLNTSKDPIVGNGQKAGSFWIRIGDYYASSSHVLGVAEPRRPDHCRQRWQKISKEVSKFCGAFAEAESEKASGMNDLDILQNAHQIYTNLYKKKFHMEYAWNVLRYKQKWVNLEAMNLTPKTTSSNKRKVDEVVPSTGSVVGEHESRPPEIKAMKKLRNKGKEKAAPSAEFSHMCEIRQKDLEGMKELQKMSILDTLIAKKETLDEDEKALKKKLMAELQRWQKISKEVSKFCGAFAEAESEKASGMNDLDILQNAHQIYTNLYKKKFHMEYAWNVLRYKQKWVNLEAMNLTPKTTSSNKRKVDEVVPSTGSVVGEHESRPPEIKAMKKLRNKGKEKAAPSAEFSHMCEIRQKDLEGMKELQKMSILDTLIAKKETLDEDEKALKKKLMAELF
ncbi:PREDICTED: glutathione S-transferase T2-like [Camelina sativa]|uniref:Glutathione S-transferase T2-like n=1 Tax=Camelina sativa TaxID=90675 RepID=A0ABM0WQ47_CAMSA|nr:PREDICTED: glutathione S-transferase T2-like [Camelina sativa]